MNAKKIAVIGLGYVGLPLSLMFAKKHDVIGFDLDKKKIEMLGRKKSYITDVPDDAVAKALRFRATDDESLIKDCEFKIICVPTPLKKNKMTFFESHLSCQGKEYYTFLNNEKPDMSFVLAAAEIIARTLQKGQIVIIESTVYPLGTRHDIIPILEKTGLKAGRDFGVAFSPERVDPCNEKYNTTNTPKVVGGIDAESLEKASKLYESVLDGGVVRVSSCEVAEATKILENTFRLVNISLINEMALLFEKMGINTWDVIDAAKTKPFGYMPFYPGFVGGHCIAVDPFYLSYKAKEYDFYTRFIGMAGIINEHMKMHAVELAEIVLKKAGKELNGANVSVFGLSYKKNINDARESGAIRILELLKQKGAKIKVYDPFVQAIKTDAGDFCSEKSIDSALTETDCAIFLVNHDEFKKIDINKLNKIVVVDCKNLFNKAGSIYIGLGKGIE
ncbi:MAG: nucleotide sugar dehydrogenase [Candidatus Aenigmarchaeota archaeon]|nr:nucleotide sugar dehydrogenase [Candidatus Aenigmarchaeota archaeon]